VDTRREATREDVTSSTEEKQQSAPGNASGFVTQAGNSLGPGNKAVVHQENNYLTNIFSPLYKFNLSF
jgi:hypothetical protein